MVVNRIELGVKKVTRGQVGQSEGRGGEGAEGSKCGK